MLCLPRRDLVDTFTGGGSVVSAPRDLIDTFTGGDSGTATVDIDAMMEAARADFLAAKYTGDNIALEHAKQRVRVVHALRVSSTSRDAPHTRRRGLQTGQR